MTRIDDAFERSTRTRYVSRSHADIRQMRRDWQPIGEVARHYYRGATPQHALWDHDLVTEINPLQGHLDELERRNR